MDLSEYKDKYPHKEQKLDKLELKARKAEILLVLKTNPMIVEMEQELESMVNGINEQLLFKRIDEKERDRLFTERACWEWFIHKFPNAQQTLENINKYLEKL